MMRVDPPDPEIRMRLKEPWTGSVWFKRWKKELRKKDAKEVAKRITEKLKLTKGKILITKEVEKKLNGKPMSDGNFVQPCLQESEEFPGMYDKIEQQRSILE